MSVELHCICGADWTGDMPGIPDAKMKEIFREIHTGPGHGLCDAKTARRARAKAERVRK